MSTSNVNNQTPKRKFPSQYRQTSSSANRVQPEHQAYQLEGFDNNENKVSTRQSEQNASNYKAVFESIEIPTIEPIDNLAAKPVIEPLIEPIQERVLEASVEPVIESQYQTEYTTGKDQPRHVKPVHQGQQTPYQPYQPRHAYNYSQPRSFESAVTRKRRWPWILAILVLLAIWIPVIYIGLGNTLNPQVGESNTNPVGANQQVETQKSYDGENSASEDSSENQGSQAGLAENSSSEGEDSTKANEAEGNSSSSSSIAAKAAGDLSWRDSDFAADMTRHTEWNFEPNGRKVVYLTIDDGPSERTQEVLDILDKYQCKATFFVTGIDPAYSYQIAEAYKRGHTIGLHTYSHDYAYVYSSTAAYWEDLTEIANVVREQIGYVPCFIRFPGGSSNGISASYTSGIMSTLVNEVTASGYQYYDWNASTGDGSEHTADELYGYACEFDQLENVILLCHDSAGKHTTVEALPRIIEHYQALGYTFEAIDRNTMVPHHEVFN